MPVHKVTDFLSEISSFFKKDDGHNALMYPCFLIRNPYKFDD